MIDPDLEVLIAFMKLGIPEGLTEYESTYHTTFEIFRLQIEGASSVQTPLERTMTTAQLYNQQHPSWTRGLSARAIRQVRNAESDLYEHELVHKISDILNELITDGHGCSMYEKKQLVNEIVSRYGKENECLR